MLAKARASYNHRDARVENMTDETTDTFYSCTLCQSFAPNHVCVVAPERTGLCGAYNWLDCKASYEINPEGPNQPIQKGEVLDAEVRAVQGGQRLRLSRPPGRRWRTYSFYSLMVDPMTTCGCCECIAAVLPMANGIMTVDRDYTGHDPLRHEVHDPGRLRRRRGPGRPGLSRPQQVQRHPEEVPRRATAASCGWSGCPRG